LEWEEEEDGFFLIRNLTKRCRRPETKKITAKITMMKRTAGLILLLLDEDGTGGRWDVCRGSESFCKTPWMVLIWEKTQVV